MLTSPHLGEDLYAPGVLVTARTPFTGAPSDYLLGETVSSGTANNRRRLFSRRSFLSFLGLGAVGGGLGAGGAATATVAGVQRGQTEAYASAHVFNSFTRIFPQLPPFATATPAVEEALLRMGAPGGILDAKDELSAGPIQLITNPDLSRGNPDNPTHTAGTTFMGQFLDHDLTFDTTSRLGVPTAPESAPNSRTPTFDLDSVYGGGPLVASHLYDPQDHVKFKVESGGLFEDLPRTPTNQAILPDPRNDENLIVAGLHCAFMLFHNRAVDRARVAHRLDPIETFAEAYRLTSWHYQWMIVHEFLPLFVGSAMAADILQNGPRYYRPSGFPRMPVEFQGSSYRFGHSMVRPSYRANLAGHHGGPFFGFVFDPTQDGKADPDDLRGGARAPRRFVGWQTFFDFGDGQVKHNKMIDTHISTPLFNLPLGAIPNHQPPQVLPQRNLLRQLTWSLPSGQSIARRMNVPALSAGDLDELKQFGVGFENSTPLWYYVLKEAELMAGGLHLGPVGGRIVGEVFIGVLRANPASYLAANPGWRPTLPMRGGGTGEFRMVDFLTFARVDPTSRGQ